MTFQYVIEPYDENGMFEVWLGGSIEFSGTLEECEQFIIQQNG